MNAWTRLQADFPDLYAGTATQFADSYEEIIRPVIDKEFAIRIKSVEQEAYDLGGRGAGQLENPPVISDPVEDSSRLARLQFRFENLVNDLNARFQAIAERNKQKAVDDVLDSITLDPTSTTRHPDVDKLKAAGRTPPRSSRPASPKPGPHVWRAGVTVSSEA
jgi:hypothetical protein